MLKIGNGVDLRILEKLMESAALHDDPDGSTVQAAPLCALDTSDVAEDLGTAASTPRMCMENHTDEENMIA